MLNLSSLNLTPLSSQGSVSIFLPTTTAVFFGDSITYGQKSSTTANSWAGILEATVYGGGALNAGISATLLQNTPWTDTSVPNNNARDSYTARATGSNKRDKIYILYGVNDIYRNIRGDGNADPNPNVDDFESDYNEIITGLLAAGYTASDIYIGSPPFFHEYQTDWVLHEQYVQACRRVALDNNLRYIDIYQAMVDGGGRTLLNSDDIHPNDAGHALIAATWLKARFIAGRPPVNLILPTISGTPTQGQTLTATVAADSWHSDEGRNDEVITYQWRADGVGISGATSSTHEVTAAQGGKVITVDVIATDIYGSTATTSAATSQVPLLRTVAQNNRIFTANGRDSTRDSALFRTHYVITDTQNLRFKIGNWSVDDDGGVFDGTAFDIVDMSVDIGGTVVPLTFGSSRAYSVTSGEDLFSDELTPSDFGLSSFDMGTIVWLKGRLDMGAINTYIVNNKHRKPDELSGNQFAYYLNSATTPSSTDTSGKYTASSGDALYERSFCFAPLLLGSPDVDYSVGLVGDSVGAGLGDGNYGAGGAGFFNRAAYGDGLTDLVATINASVGGTNSNDYIDEPKMQDTYGYCKYWGTQHAANEINQNRTLLEQQTDFLALIADFTEAGITETFAIPPFARTSSTDNFATATNQTYINVGWEVGGVADTFEAWLIAQEGVSFNYFWPTAAVRDATEPRKWKSDGTASKWSADGVHAKEQANVDLATIYAPLIRGFGVVAAPVNSVLPAITGTATEGQTLTASTGTWSGSPASYAYKFLDDDVDISGATSSTFTLTSSQVGGVIAVEVTATNAQGSTTATSAGTATVTTAVSDTTPDAFTFTDLTDQALSTTVTSNTITIAGIDADAAISVTNAQYSINGGAYTSASGTVSNGDTVTLQGDTSASNSTGVDVVLTIGGVSDTWTITTLAVSSGFAFGDVSNTMLAWFDPTLIDADYLTVTSGAVEDFTDRSTNGHVVSQSVAANRPVPVRHFGNRMLAYNGTTSILSGTDFLYTAGHYTAYIVIKPSDQEVGNGNAVVATGYSAGSKFDYGFGVDYSVTGAVYCFYRTNGNSIRININGTTNLQDGAIHIMKIVDTGTSFQIYIDDVLEAEDTDYSRAGNPDTIAFGGVKEDTEKNHFKGAIGDMLFYAGDISAADNTDIMNKLQDRIDGTEVQVNADEITSISSLKIMIDPSVSSTISETAGSVTQMDDLSGNDNHVTQTTASLQMSAALNFINTKRVLETVTQGQRLNIDFTLALQIFSGSYTLIMGLQPSLFGNKNVFSVSGSGAGGSRGVRIREGQSSNTKFKADMGGTSSILNSTEYLPDYGLVPHVWSLRRNGTTGELLSAEKGLEDTITNAEDMELISNAWFGFLPQDFMFFYLFDEALSDADYNKVMQNIENERGISCQQI